MSSKINVYEIISGHFETLKERNGSYSTTDLFTFVGLPLSACFFSYFYSFNLNTNLSSLLVNFGSIFTALLLSVLVLVYDQESKLEDKKNTDGFYDEKKELLRQLYYNISFSILCSVILVLACFIHSVVFNKTVEFTVINSTYTLKSDIHLITPLVAFVTANLFLNILMILKRMHALLVSQ